MSAPPKSLSSRTAYRALMLGPDGVVVRTERLIASDDEEAVSLARAMVNGHAVEVWDGVRFIDHLEAETLP